MVENKKCPKCGKKMIKWYDTIVLLSNPPQYPWRWRCGCGCIEIGGVEVAKTSDELFMEQWRDANAVNCT